MPRRRGGAANTGISTLGLTASNFPASSPLQDWTNTAGANLESGTKKVTDIGWRMPYPWGYGQTNASGAVTNIPNSSGRVDSLAELGYVNTGAVSWTNATPGGGANGVPHRTLNLQHSRSSGGLPDWALLDLFALPPQSSSYVFQPYTNTGVATTYGAVGGRVNINGLIYPFATNANNIVVRTNPLVALLSGASNPLTGDTAYLSNYAGNFANNILMAPINPSSYLDGGNAWALYDSTNGLYAHVGELAEISQLTDGGKTGEGNLYELLAQTTVSDNVFTIYTIGQALKQTVRGRFVVNGDKRYEVTIERNANVVAAPANQGVFRIVSVREITP